MHRRGLQGGDGGTRLEAFWVGGENRCQRCCTVVTAPSKWGAFPSGMFLGVYALGLGPQTKFKLGTSGHDTVAKNGDFAN